MFPASRLGKTMMSHDDDVGSIPFFFEKRCIQKKMNVISSGFFT
jgi:hypothetical protein